MTPQCPECGAEISATALVCPRCGFPLREQPLANQQAGNPRTNRVGTYVAAGVGGCLLLPFIGGIVAALVIPRLAANGQRSREIEADGLLKQVYSLEMAYQADHDRYAASFDELRSVGWADSPARYYDLRITSARPHQLCVDAVPRPGADVSPRSVDEQGSLRSVAACGAAPAP